MKKNTKDQCRKLIPISLHNKTHTCIRMAVYKISRFNYTVVNKLSADTHTHTHKQTQTVSFCMCR